MSMPLYQKRLVPFSEIVERIDVGDPGAVSPIVLGVSPCRSGTTILLRVFGAAGVPAYFQPFKNILRWQLQDLDSPAWVAPQAPERAVFIKETLGPYTAAESGFDPLAPLLAAGYPPHRLHVMIVGRSPLTTWTSWAAWWQGRTSVELLALAYETTERVRLQALAMGIPVTTFVYEVLRDNTPPEVIRPLFARLGLAYTPLAVGGWEGLPALGAPGSNVILPEEPPVFVTPHIHTQVERSVRLAYSWRVENLARLHAEDVDRINQAGLAEIYTRWRMACAADLELEIAADDDWEIFAHLHTPAVSWRPSRRPVDSFSAHHLRSRQ